MSQPHGQGCVACLDNSHIQPNTGDPGGEENDGNSPGLRRIAVRDCRDELIWFIWFVLFIWFVSFNQINKKNQPVLALHASRSVALEDLFSILLARIIHDGSSRNR
ncbi:MAG: hypothetical protein ACRD9S_26345 [Pyrinomonadaceae bacterium]